MGELAMKKKEQSAKLDQTDLRILNKLQANARITNQELADSVGLSASPCLQRVKRMENAGVISGFNTTIDLHKVCRHVDVIATVTLNSHGLEDFENFERTVKSMHYVVECTKVAGNIDYLVRFVCPDIGSYQMLSDELLRLGPKIGNLSSYTVLKDVRRFAGVAIDSLVTS
jgi:DNA-binding Lrp family transcriptional regulator